MKALYLLALLLIAAVAISQPLGFDASTTEYSLDGKHWFGVERMWMRVKYLHPDGTITSEILAKPHKRVQ